MAKQDNPIQAQHLKLMNAMGALLGDTFPDSGFCLLVFDFGAGGTMNYISNAQRADMISAMKEFIALEESTPVPGPTTPQ